MSASVRPAPLRLGVSVLAISLVIAGGSCAAAANLAANAAAARPPAAPAQLNIIKATATSSSAPSVRITPRHRRRNPRSTVYRTVQLANSAARDYPRAGAYVNSTVYYDYEPGRIYTVQTSPQFLTVIALRPGEKLISKAAGDTVRWVLGETAQGSGPTEQVLVMLKPVRGGLHTNVVLTTDQRTYLIDASSSVGPAYTSMVGWNYPQEQMREIATARAAQAQTVAAGVVIDNLHFDYDIRPIRSRRPAWEPVRVFDDGLKTYIQFPTNMAAKEAPPLFLVGRDNRAQLVNYRYVNGYYVVDRIIDVAELRLGEDKQTIVRITRTGSPG